MKKRWLALLLALLMVMGTVGMAAAVGDATEEDVTGLMTDEEEDGEGPPEHIQKMLDLKAGLKGQKTDNENEEEDDEQGPPDFVLEMKARKINIMSKSKLMINGHPIFSDLPPVIKEGRTLIPVGAVVKGLGADLVEWNATTKTVTIIKYDEDDEDIIDVEIVLEIGKNVYTVTKDGTKEIFNMDTAAEILGNRTFVPLKYIALAMGEDVEYNKETKVINVGKKLGHLKQAEEKMTKDDEAIEKLTIEEVEEEEE